MPRGRATATVVMVLAMYAAVRGQQTPLPATLVELADAERAFAERATVVGWKQAFLDYFAEDAVGFDGDKAVSARDQLREVPDPPKDLQLLWEPRYGDIAASGDFGWLTGPSTTINPARNNGTPRYGNYASIWKRQADGRFKVLLDVGINVPSEVTFEPGFSRAPNSDRYNGADSLDAATQALRDADATLNTVALGSQETAYRGRLAEGARLHRPGLMPMADEPAILAWLTTQPRHAAGEVRHAEVAGSRDLGYTYGAYALPPSGSTAERGFYTRVWSRGRDGVWKVVLDVLQPQ